MVELKLRRIKPIDRSNWTEEYKQCTCGHPKHKHISRQDPFTREMAEYCSECICMKFVELKEGVK